MTMVAAKVHLPQHMKNRVIPLIEWQSLGLVLSEKKAWLSFLRFTPKSKTWRGHNKDAYYNYNWEGMKKSSIKQQCQKILDRYGWMPNKLSYDKIKHSMKQRQIEKYGNVVREFVKKYNKTSTAMKLSKKLQMPKNYEMSEILSLSRFVNNLSPRSLKKLLNSMDEETLRQLLVNNMNYYLDANNREKYLNHSDPVNNESNQIHHRVLATIKKKLKKDARNERLKYGKNVFDKLCVELSSYILSFCDEFGVNQASRCCHTLFKASKQPNARTVVTIDAQKLSQKTSLFQDEIKKRYSVPTIILKNTAKGFPNRFENHLNDIIQSNTLSSLSMGHTSLKLSARAMKVCRSNQNLNISTFYSIQHTVMDLPDNLLFNLQTLKVKHLGLPTLKNVQRLLINNIDRSNPMIDVTEFVPLPIDADDPVFPILPPVPNIFQYLNPPSKLKKLEIWNSMRCPLIVNGDIVHPIFWLWNAKNLETATISVDFNQQSNFREQCQILFKSSAMLQTAKQQGSFTELSILIDNQDNATFDDWKNMLSWIPMLYPNLKKLTYVRQLDFRGVLSEELEWNSCFGNLEYIEVDIPLTTENAMSLIESIRTNKDDSFKDLKVLKLKDIMIPHKKVMRTVYKAYHTDSCITKVNELKLKHFINQIGLLLRDCSLISLVLSMQHDRGILSWNIEWPHRMYFNCFGEIAAIIRDNSTYDGYLSFGLPSIHIFRNMNWREEDVEGSLQIAQTINQIHQIRAESNLCNRDKKLIVELKGLVLYEGHREFLQFWYGFGKRDLFEYRPQGGKMRLIMPYYS